MKTLVAYLVSPLLFWLGHLMSLPMYRFDWWWLYRPYNRLMVWSGDIEDWAGVPVMWKRV